LKFRPAVPPCPSPTESEPEKTSEKTPGSVDLSFPHSTYWQEEITVISNRSFVRSFIAGAILALSILAAAAENPTMTASKTGYAPVNGLNLYYEIYGAGEPLVLLHGGAGAIEIFSSIMPDLSRNHQA
jgi:hypothetical protein